MDTERVSSMLFDEIKSKTDLTINQKALLIALFECRGLISQAERLAGVSRHVHVHAINNNKTYQYYFNLIPESIIDVAEDRLFKRLEYGDMRAIEYFLDRKGKARGYTPEIQFNLPPVAFNINFGGNPDRQITYELQVTPSAEVDDIESRNTAQTKLIDQSTDVSVIQLIETTQSINQQLENKTQLNNSDTSESNIEI